MYKHFSKSRGFTLAELLVVIAIIGLLSGIVLANVGPAREDARNAKRQSDLSQISIALKLYEQKTGGGYPAGAGEIEAGEAVYDALNQSMSSIPVDPIDDSTHFYSYDSSFFCNGRDVTAIYATLEGVDGNISEVCGMSPGSTFIIVLN